jgi:hypothetical protein
MKLLTSKPRVGSSRKRTFERWMIAAANPALHTFQMGCYAIVSPVVKFEGFKQLLSPFDSSCTFDTVKLTNTEHKTFARFISPRVLGSGDVI